MLSPAIKDLNIEKDHQSASQQQMTHVPSVPAVASARCMLSRKYILWIALTSVKPAPRLFTHHSASE